MHARVTEPNPLGQTNQRILYLMGFQFNILGNYYLSKIKILFFKCLIIQSTYSRNVFRSMIVDILLCHKNTGGLGIVDRHKIIIQPIHILYISMYNYGILYK